MKRLIFFFVLLSLSVGSMAKSNGWIALFNGRNLDGWKQLNGTAVYTVVNGEIVGKSVVDSPNSFLATEATYGDFILEYEMKMERGLNSGVQIRSISDPAINKGRVFGYQVECDDSPRGWSAGIYDEARRGWLYPLDYNQPARKAYKNGEWNSYRVECVGSSIRTWLNGIPCANLVDDMTAKGFIALQVHGIGKKAEEAGKTISWRNIRITTEKLAKEQKKMDESVPEVSYLNNVLTKREQKLGWQLIWDGTSLNGWTGMKAGADNSKGWTIKDGELIANLPENKGGSDIITQKEYKNFILEVDFKYTTGANGGIKYFIQPDGKGGYSNVGCEYQVLDDEKHPDAKAGIDGNRTCASLYDLIKANAQNFDPAQMVKRTNGANQWNRARIEVRGEKVVHYLNGIKVVEYIRGTPEWKKLVATSKFAKVAGFGEYPTGHLLIQSHQDEVHYRNVKVLELK